MPFSEETLTRLKADAAEITGRYPRARSALLPLLYLVQAEEGYVSDEGMAFCAEVLGITQTEVRGVATFYTMYKHEPAGRVPGRRLHQHDLRDHGRRPDLRRARRARRRATRAQRRLGGTTTATSSPDGKVAVERLECNAACDYAPVVMVNWEFFDNQTPQSAKQLVDDLRAGQRRDADPRPEPAVHLEAGQPDPRRVRRRPGGRGPVGRARPAWSASKLAKERGWKAPRMPRPRSRPSLRRPSETAPRKRRTRVHGVQRGLRLRPGGDGQLGVLRQPDPGLGQAAGGRPAGRRGRAGRPAARTACAPGSRSTGSGRLRRRPGGRGAVGRARQPGRPRSWPRNAAGRRPPDPEPVLRDSPTGRQVVMTDTLTPVLTANWDQPDSFTIEGYRRHRRVRGAAQGPRDGAGRRDRHGEGRGAARPRRRGLPDRHEVVLHPAERRQAALPDGQRGRVRAGHVQGHPADDGQPARAHRGHHHHLLRHPGQPRVHLRARRGAARHQAAAVRGGPGLRGGLPRRGHPRQRLRPRHRGARRARAPTSAARRRRCSPRSRGTAGCRATGRRSRRWRACTPARRSSTTSSRSPACRRSSPTAPNWFAGLGTEKSNGLRHLLAVRAREEPGAVRGAARHHPARADRPGGRHAPAGAPAQVLDAGRLVDPAADPRAPGRPARLRGRGRGRVDARHPGAAAVRRHHLRAAGGAALDGVLPARVVRQVHAVPRGLLLAGPRRSSGWRTARATTRTWTRSSTWATTSWAARSAPSATRCRCRSARPSSTSATRSSSTASKAAARSTRPLRPRGRCDPDDCSATRPTR